MTTVSQLNLVLFKTKYLSRAIFIYSAVTWEKENPSKKEAAQ